jgi:hypothetical protein
MCLVFLVLLYSGHAPARATATNAFAHADRFLNILTALGKKEYARAVADSEALIRDDPAFPLTYESWSRRRSVAVSWIRRKRFSTHNSQPTTHASSLDSV